jgi:polysaccharide pyruvyl transferase WcaK-like protein
MRVLIDSGSYHCLNVGDVAMLQTAIERLRALWPGATFGAVTSAPDALARHCPGVEPIPLAGRVAFLSDCLLGRAHRRLPRSLQAVFDDFESFIRGRWPRTLSAMIGAKRVVAGRADASAPAAFVGALLRADLLLVSGAGVLTDAFIENATGVLASMALAQRWNVTTALMGQGIGPVADDALRQQMAAVLPHARLIAVREGRESPHLLASAGVLPEKIVVTGDDAIEMANRRAQPHLGDAIGVNVRMARYAEVDPAIVRILGPVIQRAAARLSASVQPLPIAHHPDCHDGVAIQAVLSGGDGSAGRIAELDTPAQAIDAVARCRTVVTGSYHAAVFALAQGIPVVALARSPYYLAKFRGLGELFPGGCHIVTIGDCDAAQLEAVIMSAWMDAPRVRDGLLNAAAAQIASGRAAYQQLRTNGTSSRMPRYR